MSNQMYGYNPSYGGSGLSNVYPSRSIADPYLSDSSLMGSSRYLSSDSLSASDSSKYSLYLSQNDGLRYPGSDIGGMSGGFSGSRNSGGIGSAGMATATNQLLSHASWPGVDVTVAYDPVGAGAKRSTEAFYHQTVLGTHNTIGQSEALFSTNSLAKRPRFESATSLPIYPQRQGEKDCAHYMLTRTCKFGESCKFDHPIWVPEGGIPDWKEVPLSVTSETLPERPGEPDCPYFLKTQKCKFGFRCKFNHPKDTADPLGASETVDTSVLPERPTEAPCSFYMKTGKCKFGATCKFHHPKDIQIPSSGQENGDGGQIESAVGNDGTTGGDAMPAKQFVPFTPALLHNSKGLPIRLGEVDCPFYLKTGSCKYGATCRYNHPDRYGAINTSIAAALGQAVMPSPATNMNIGVMNPSASFFPTVDPRLAQTTMGSGPTIYPQRPGQIECDFYMKTGECKFGERCKFHHPIDRSATTPTMAKQALQQNVKLTLAGLPRREGSIICPFYMKTGTCKYGVTCRFDHPPPGEAIAMATVQGTQGASAASIEGEGEDNKESETVQEH